MKSIREIVIVSAAAIAVVCYVGFNIFNSGRKADEKNAPDNMGDFIDRVNAEIIQSDLSEIENDILSRLSTNIQDPFWQSDALPAPPVEQKEAVEKLPTYGGYLRTGDRSIAVIDGLEYEEGERLVQGDFTVLKILPDQLVLRGDKNMEHTISMMGTEN